MGFTAINPIHPSNPPGKSIRRPGQSTRKIRPQSQKIRPGARTIRPKNPSGCPKKPPGKSIRTSGQSIRDIHPKNPPGAFVREIHPIRPPGPSIRVGWLCYTNLRALFRLFLAQYSNSVLGLLWLAFVWILEPSVLHRLGCKQIHWIHNLILHLSVALLYTVLSVKHQYSQNTPMTGNKNRKWGILRPVVGQTTCQLYQSNCTLYWYIIIVITECSCVLGACALPGYLYCLYLYTAVTSDWNPLKLCKHMHRLGLCASVQQDTHSTSLL